MKQVDRETFTNKLCQAGLLAASRLGYLKWRYHDMETGRVIGEIENLGGEENYYVCDAVDTEPMELYTRLYEGYNRESY